jgi:phenylalanyl-tRNA synthetase beta chain
MTPAVEENFEAEIFRERVSDHLAAQGFHEIMTNSITNGAWFSDKEQEQMVRMMNSLSAEHNILRNSLFETSLQVVAYNLNHKNNNLRLFEFGKAYSTHGPGRYTESEKLCLVLSGSSGDDGWNQKSRSYDFYSLKGAVKGVFDLLGVKPDSMEVLEVPKLDNHVVFKLNNEIIAGLGEVKKTILTKFGIKQPVYFAGLNWAMLSHLAVNMKTEVKDLPRFPSVQRDIAMILDRGRTWSEISSAVEKIRLSNLRDMKLFDIFESEKLGAGKKSVAVNFTFLDAEKTLTDKEIDGWMEKIMKTMEKELGAEIRKG